MLAHAGKFQQTLFLFLTGGFLYCGIETLFRGYSHVSMLMAGGLCFILIGHIRKDMSLISKMFLSVFIITFIELFTGILVNIMLGWNVWDYSEQQYNLLGQICLLFCNIWFFLSLPAILCYDYLCYWLMGGEKPNYKVL